MTDEQLEKENAELSEVMHEKVKELAKYFDSVQIFCTKHESDKIGTSHLTECSGNYFARYGQIKLWVEKQSLNGEEIDS